MEQCEYHMKVEQSFIWDKRDLGPLPSREKANEWLHWLHGRLRSDSSTVLVQMLIADVISGWTQDVIITEPFDPQKRECLMQLTPY